MKTARPFYLTICLLLCRIISHVIAGVHYFAVHVLYLKIPACIRHAPGGVYKNLQKIWLARYLKKVVSVWVRSPLRNQVLQLVKLDFKIPDNTGIVFVTCHTPWKRLLVQWFFQNHYALIIDTGKSAQRKDRLKNKRKGHSELLHIIRHLRYGGRIIIAADVFDKSNTNATEI